MKQQLVLTVGNEMMGDDAAGPLLARMMRLAPVDDWDVLDGGSAPENCVFKIRELAPSRVLIVDSAEMELAAGEVRLIDSDHIASLFLLTSHSLPLSYLMDSLRESMPVVDLIGIQPQLVAFGCPVSDEVKRAVERLYGWLKNRGDPRGAAEPI